MKLIIAGGRDFNDVDLMGKSVEWDKITEVVCGEARGADFWGKQHALMRGIPVTSFPANWEAYGKSAGHRRNREMGDYADELIAFWDGESKGTQGMIEYMKKLGKPVKVVQY